MEWRTRLTDKLRELMYPTLFIYIVGSIYLMGYTREKEADATNGLATLPLPLAQRIGESDFEDDKPAASAPTSQAAAATPPGLAAAPSASASTAD